MGHKIPPKSSRLVITKDWDSKWFAGKNDYPLLVIEDEQIRNKITKHYGSNSGIARILINRNPQEITINISTSKPGVLIGRQGKSIEEIKKILAKTSTKKIHLNIIEIKRGDLNANIVSASIGNQITKRIAYRRAVKQAIEKVMQSGAKGVKIIVSGRLNGAEIARRELYNEGSMPSSSLDEDIDFSIFHAKTTYGIIGIKVWIYIGKLNLSSDDINAVKTLF